MLKMWPIVDAQYIFLDSALSFYLNIFFFLSKEENLQREATVSILVSYIQNCRGFQCVVLKEILEYREQLNRDGNNDWVEKDHSLS